MHRVQRRLATAGVLIAALLAAPPAEAFSAPVVFLKEADASNQPMGNWIALAGASMHSVNRYEVGVRVQDTGQPGNQQRFLVQVNSVPGGAPPNQPDVYSICPIVTGAAGQIVDLQEDVRYQGDGPYSITVTVAPPTGDSSHGCTAGPSTTGSFTASAPTTLRFLGHMVTSNPIRAPFGGLEVFPAVGSGGSEIRCARDPRPAAHGTLTGSLVVNQAGDGYVEPHWTISAGALFEQPGSYACVGRSVGGGDVPGPWSAPTATADVQTGFYPKPRSWRLSNTHGPVFKLTGRISSPLSVGGRLSVVIRRTDKHARVVRLETLVRVGGVVSLRFRLPPASYAGFPPSFVMSFSFGGSRFVAARPRFGAFWFRLVPVRGGNQLQFGGACRPLRC